MKIAVFAADERMKKTAAYLRKFYQVVEIDEEDSMGRLRKQAPEFSAVVLPAWGIEENGFVRMQTKGLFAAEFLESLSASCRLFSGNECAFFQHLQCQVNCWLKDEQLQKKNADLTAEGLLCRLIETTDQSLWSYCIDIIGTGRCGTSLAQLFKKMGISYRLITSSQKKLQECTELIGLSEWQSSNPSTLIVNTAPACIIHQQVLKNWKQPCQVYDLASNGCGVDVRCLKHPYLKLFVEPALPSRFSSGSAARLIAQWIEKELRA